MAIAPPIIRGGMHITNNVTNNNVTNVTNITNVTIVAPASATANGQAVNTSVPAQPRLAAAKPHVVKAVAPAPIMTKSLPAYTPGRPLAALPQPQVVHADVPPALMHPVNQPHPPAMKPRHMPPPVQHQVNQSQPRPGVANPACLSKKRSYSGKFQV